ncbi:UPF0280 family protein [Puniceibacterium sp. IMCC21224]|uniref:UPF0280 family protein n=1 Tax=Puniceibacterium sp. IMCC21224 TaxID=1618204 RepID=UPI00064D9221|nr:UPF0280 family protein [Puniceibacterium sp. IMCC21224]KMK67283.1 hypothetical protein IMCC21224_112151 [Puniceibacterium sp. IMCC21224]
MQSARLSNGTRLHLHHGPIDLVIGAEGEAGAREHAFAAAERRFATILSELVPELPLLRSNVGPDLNGAIARRMVAAVRPHAADGFVTPMAAVAGAVAETVLAAMTDAVPLYRAYVNNGGDIALHLMGDARFAVAMAASAGRSLGELTLTATDPWRGIATSGQGGRSLSLGIADSVTVLAQTAAQADVAATLIANAVDLPGHPAIARVPAQDRDPDSDLGHRLTVTHVGALSRSEIDTALDHGTRRAQDLADRGLIAGAALFLRGAMCSVGLPRHKIEQDLTITGKTPEHA